MTVMPTVEPSPQFSWVFFFFLSFYSSFFSFFLFILCHHHHLHVLTTVQAMYLYTIKNSSHSCSNICSVESMLYGMPFAISFLNDSNYTARGRYKIRVRLTTS